MNKIFKVIYSKTRHCYVVVSELAKSHCKTAGSHTARSKTALTAAVLLALGAFSFAGMPVAQADESLLNNDFIGANDYYWYYDEKTGEWKTYQYKPTDIFNNRSRHDLPNYQGGGAKLPGAVTAGLYAQAGQQTITIGDRNAGQSKGSVFIGERSGYNNGDNAPAGLKNNYVTSVGFQSDATGWGSIAIGSNATAENSKMDSQVVKEVGNANTSGTVKDDTYGIEENPTIQGASVALGYDAHSKDGNIAIGAYSDATTDLSADTSDKAKAYLTKETAASYVSVGSSDVKRRIMNVADGAADSDVATIGQLKKMSEKAGVYNEGWGIKIGDYTKKDANGTETTVKNAISVDRNLGSNEITTKSKNTFKAAGENSLILGGAGTDDLVYINGSPRETQFGAYGKDSVLVGGENNKITDAGTYAVISGGGQNIASGEKSFIGGGWWNTAKGATSTVLGGQSNTASGNQSTIVGGDTNRAIGIESSILGGFNHTAIGDHSTISGGDGAYTFGTYSSVSGGQGNVAIGVASSADGGWLNYSYGDYSQANGGYSNYTLGNASSSLGGRNGVVQGNVSVGIAGGSTEAGAGYALAAGYQSVVTAAGVHREKSNDVVDSYLEAGNNTGGNEGYKYTDVATALGYQATADAPNTVSFGHDKGDVSGYTVNWDYEFETDTQGNIKFDENGMPLVKSMKPNSITTNYYDTAKYNRLVKAADGIEDHDAVVMEQLKNASDVGSNIKVYKTDTNGNVLLDENSDPIEDTSDTAKTNREAAQKASEDAWAAAIGTGEVADPTTKSDTNNPETNGSKQLVTGGTVYNALQKQKTDLTDDLSVHAGWGINITNKEDASGKVTKNFVSLSRNLGRDADTKDKAVLKADEDKSALVIGGRVNPGDTKGGQTTEKDYGALGQDSVTVGGADNTASGDAAVVVGGLSNTSSAQYSTVVGGSANDAIGNESAVFGGHDNDAYGTYATSSGGSMNRAYGEAASVFGGGANSALGASSVAVGGLNSTVNGAFAVGIAGGSTNADYALAAGNGANVTVENGTAIGYQATTDEAGTIAFGHDAGDAYYSSTTWPQKATKQNGKYYDANNKEITKAEYDALKNSDGTWNDYSKTPTVVEKTYDKAAYNRLVKVADGIDDHDVVVMEQLKQYAEKDASNLGNNIKVYKTDENGNVQLGDDKKPIEDKDATTTAQKANKDAWGKALGADTFSTGTSDKTTDASTSDQLVTGKTLYDYDAPVAETGKKLTYVSANNTTGQNLTALDAQVAANTSTLNDKTHNIKYYSVNDQAPLSNIDGYSNEGNDGAKGRGSIAAGFNTHADGIASTVVGSYSGVLNQNVNGGFRGATALSYGTFNINQNTDPEKSFSGVANSIIGQANATTNSNAAIIYGAGNTVTNSYRGIDGTNVSDIMKAASSKDVKKLYEALQKAVPNSGAQVMVMGGGNSVDKAYMTQVTGVGNKVSGQNSIYEKGTSTQYNFVDGFQNELSNGQHDYIIGTENKVSGDSVDKNQSNIIFGDNHKLTNQKNNVIIGSSDTADDETAVSDAVIIGHNAKVSAEGGVAIGSGSQATVAGNTVAGYDAKTGKDSEDTTATWKATNAAVSIGTADGKVTRQINGLAAGTKDTDAVNVAQLKELEGMKANVDASNIGSNITVAPIYKKDDNGKDVVDQKATEEAEKTARTANENAWGTAIGTGEVAKDNGQLVTGGKVYDALHGGLTDITIGKPGTADQDGKDGEDGSIGLVGPKGQNGKDGKTTTIIKTETGAAGVNGKDGKDGITRIYYYDQTNTNDKHAVATLDDGMKFGDDFDSTATVKLNHQLDIVGDINAGKKNGDKKATKDDLSDGNIGVVATDTTYNEDGTVNTNGKMTIKLAKDLKGLHSSTYTTTETTGEGDNKQTTDYTTTIDSKGVTIQSKGTKDGKPETVNGPSMTIDGINGGGKQITNVGDGFKKNADGSYTISETDKKNAANIGDVQTIVDKATKDLTDGTNGLNKKANVDASNIGSNITVAPIYKKDDSGKDVIDPDATKKAEDDARTANENAWGTAIGTGKVADPTQSTTNDPTQNGSQQLVTGGEVYKALHGGLDNVVFGHDGKDGSIGLVGQTGKKGEDGKNAYATTIIKTEKGVDGVDGKNGKDGITRIVYNDTNDPANKHTVATLDDGMKYAGDTGDVANVKLDHQLKLSGTTFNDKDKKYDANSWTSDNIAVVSSAADETTGDATMYLKLNKDLNLTDKGSVRFGDKDSNTTLDASGLTIKSTVTKEGKTEVVSGPSMTKDGIDGGSKAITNIGSGIEKDDKGNYTDKSKSSAANIGDVQTIVNDAKKELTDGTNGLNSKANVDASNIGENLKDAKGNKASADAIKKNKEDWASAIGTDEVKEGNKQLVTSDAVAKELAKKADKSYVDQELGKKADKTYVDEKLDTKANKSDVYTKNETYSKSEVDSKVTDITKGLDGKAGKDLDNISDKGKTVIHNIAKDAVEVVKGKNTTVTKVEGTDTTPTKYAVNVEGTGKVASGDTGLISGDTLYKEVHVDKDGSYVKSSNTVGQSLSALDTGLKTTSNLIHTNDKGDTIQIGSNSTATKIDVSGKDANGNTTGRVITGVVSDASDPNSAANVGYVNGLTAANTQQIYRDMNNAYSRLDTNINRAAAGSNALAALHPLDFDPADKASFAVGYGHYHNANAAAVGAFYQPNANTMVNMGISLGNGDPGFNAGVPFKIGKGSAYNGVSKAEMAQTIHDQAAEISTIKANDAAKDKRIDALEKENQEMKKQIQEILARLNG